MLPWQWFLVLAICFWSSTAFTHDDADWIMRGNFANPMNPNEPCCGPSDCKMLDPKEYTRTRAGYTIKDSGEFIPQSEVQPFAPSGFWLCRRPSDGKRRCAFDAPAKSMSQR